MLELKIMPQYLKHPWLIIFIVLFGAFLFTFNLRPKSPGIKMIVYQVPVGAVPPTPVLIPLGFSIQVYSFQDHNRAQKAFLSLKNAGYKAFMVVSNLKEKGTWYRVRIGGIPDLVQAHKMLVDVRRKYNSGFILDPSISYAQ